MSTQVHLSFKLKESTLPKRSAKLSDVVNDHIQWGQPIAALIDSLHHSFTIGKNQ